MVPSYCKSLFTHFRATASLIEHEDTLVSPSVNIEYSVMCVYPKIIYWFKKICLYYLQYLLLKPIQKHIHEDRFVLTNHVHVLAIFIFAVMMCPLPPYLHMLSNTVLFVLIYCSIANSMETRLNNKMCSFDYKYMALIM